MNDPHVVSLTYKVEHGKQIDYSNAEPFVLEEDKFYLEVKDNRVRFEFKNHYATEGEAKDSIEDYIRIWEFDAGLKYGPNAFRLKFTDAEVIDRNPTPGMTYPKPLRVEVRVGNVNLILGKKRYPSPPCGMRIDPDVKAMYSRYIGHIEGKELLASMTYFCLTVLERKAGSRKAVAEKYRISNRLLDKIGTLASAKGGQEARKATGTGDSFTGAERQFLQQAIGKMIRRAAEAAYSSPRSLPKITMKDLPPLP